MDVAQPSRVEHRVGVNPPEPTKAEFTHKLFEAAPFIRELGIEVESVEPGRVTTRLEVKSRHHQQNGVVHAGVLATMADHTAGGAATTMLADGQMCLTVEFKINLLRPAVGPELMCRSEVLRAGRSLVVVESEVFDRSAQGEQRLVAKAMVTLASVESAGFGRS